MTLVESDLELFLDAEVSPEQGCESPWHYDPPGPTNHHSEGGPLWYVHFTKQCFCNGSDIEIRCNSWALAMMGKEDKRYGCPCGGTWSVIVLEPIENY